MAHTINHGRARPVSTEDFNERVKRLLDAKPDLPAKSGSQKLIKRQPPIRPKA